MLYRKYFQGSNIIMNINLKFKREINSIKSKLNAIDYEFIKRIDNAEVKIIDDRLYISTPHGLAGLNKLSTGCKACILANHLNNKLINLTLCGENAIISLFELIPNSSNSFLLTHNEFQPANRYSFNLNNSVTGNLFNLWDTIALEGERR
jgi:hypothetical protein